MLKSTSRSIHFFALENRIEYIFYWLILLLCEFKQNWYSIDMTLYEYYMIFPDGDAQEISGALEIGSLYDMNGYPLTPPLPTNKMIVYQVCGKRTREERGIVRISYTMEQLDAMELRAYI
jgi:hypothetical protein